MFNFFILFFLNHGFAKTMISFDSYFYVQNFQVADAILNQGNQILKLPYRQGDVDLRAELKWRDGTDLAVLRPRLQATFKEANYAIDQSEQETKTVADITDAFYEHYWSGRLSSTLGLQVYQWGPAEFFNSSNPFYHFSSQQRSLIHKEKGQVLLRVNYSSDKNNSLVFAIQPISNNQPEWIAEDAFTPKYLIKYEKSWENSANYAGFVFGSQEKSTAFVGEYFNFAPVDGFSLYADVKHSQKPGSFVPEFNGTSYDLVPVAQEEKPWSTLGVFGLRWEDSYDIRFEYIHNSAGFDREELATVIASASNAFSPLFLQNLNRFQHMGLELLGRNYFYVSYRISDPFKFKEFNFYTRFIQSMQDNSSLTQLEIDKALLDSVLIFSSFSYVNGELDTEFRLINDWQFLAGIKWGI